MRRQSDSHRWWLFKGVPQADRHRGIYLDLQFIWADIDSHEPFESPETAVRDERDIVSRREAVEVLDKRILVGDTDAGIKMKEKIADLKHLIAAYRSGEIAERDD